MTGSHPVDTAPPPPSRSHLVSVVTIFLDAAAFLCEAIESVLSQDYPDWELLLVDDGSMDHGSDIAREYARHRPGQCDIWTIRVTQGHAEDLGRDFIQPLAIGQSQVVTPPNLVPGWLLRPFDTPATSGAMVRTDRLRENRPASLAGRSRLDPLTAHSVFAGTT